MDLADAHAHFFEGGYRGRYGRASSGGDDLAVYESLRDAHGIDLSLVIGYEGGGYAGNNAFIRRLASERSWVAPLAHTPTDRPSTPGPPFVGLSVYLRDPAEGAALASWPADVLDQLERMRSILSINAAPAALSAAAGVIRRLGACQVLISHLGLPGRFPEVPSKSEVVSALEPLLALADQPHVGVKLSGLYAISDPPSAYPHRSAGPFIDQLVAAFGADRLFWGSDYSPALDFVSFEQTVRAVSDLPWTADQLSAVMGRNLRRVVASARGEPAVSR